MVTGIKNPRRVEVWNFVTPYLTKKIFYQTKIVTRGGEGKGGGQKRNFSRNLL